MLKDMHTAMYIVIVFCVILANVLSVAALTMSAINIKAVIELKGLQSLVDSQMNVILSIDNASTSVVVNIVKGQEVRIDMNIDGGSIRKGSYVIIQGYINGSNVLKFKLTLHEAGWRVTEADYNDAVFKPIPNEQLLNVKLFTNIAQVQIFIPNYLVTDETIEVKIGDELITPTITKTSNGTMIRFNAFISFNETGLMSVNIFKGDKKLLHIIGTIPTSSNFTTVKIEGVFNQVQVKILRGQGLVEFSIPTSILKETPINDRGVIFTGLMIDIKPISTIQANREVRIYVLDEYSKRVIQKPVTLAIYIETYKSWLNLTFTSGNITVIIPKETAVIYAHAEGYEDGSVVLDAESSQAIVYLRNKSPSGEERILRFLSYMHELIMKNLLVFLLIAIIVFALILIWKLRR
jgi:hypothetical protein